MTTQRLDHWMVEQGLVKSRSQATRLIRAGFVMVDGQVVNKPSRTVTPEVEIQITRDDRYVGRGGEKLEAALEYFKISVEGRKCLDVGASTGGFTDCLLQHGAAEVLAIDVGHDQLDAGLRQDSRVKNIEGINARYLDPKAFGEAFEIIVADVSFISLILVLPGMVGQAAKDAELIALIKPQFELGSKALNRKGVVRKDELRKQAVKKVVTWFQNTDEWSMVGVTDSPITGGDGNREYLIYAKRN